MQSSKIITVVVSALAGTLGGGAAATWAAAHARPPEAVHVEASKPASAERAASPVLNPGREQLNQQLQQLRQIEARVGKLEQPVTETQPSPSPQEVPPPGFYQRQHEVAIREHQAEVVDPAWGPATTSVMREDFQQMQAAGQFQVGAVACKTTTCSVVFKWASMDQARNSYMSTVSTALRVGCARTIIVPDEPNRDGTVDATMLLDCADWRASGAQVLAKEQLPPPPLATREGAIAP